MFVGLCECTIWAYLCSWIHVRHVVERAPLLTRLPLDALVPNRQQLVTDTLSKVKLLPTSNPAAYAALLKGLIAQGAHKLGEKEIKVVCRREDQSIVENAIAELKKDDRYASLVLTLHERFLAASMCVTGVIARRGTWWAPAGARGAVAGGRSVEGRGGGG